MRLPSFVACSFVVSLILISVGVAVSAEPEPNPDFPPTVVRFEWLRFEHQHPEERSPRPRPKHVYLIRNNFDSLKLAIEDLMKTFGNRYPKGAEFLRRLETIERSVLETQSPLQPLAKQFDQLLEEALLANPLIDFDSLIFIDRKQGALTPRNWLSLTSMNPSGHDNAVKVLSPVSPQGKVTSLFTPSDKKCVAQMDLHFDAEKLLYSSAGENGQWQICEVDLPPKLDPETGQPIVREIETIPDSDVENYDACYGPDGSIYFTSTATQLGVPCIRGSSPISNLYRRKPDGQVERLTIDQDHNWHPSMLPNGRVMYLRWEYTDTPHAFNRVVFSMNPDGTDQAAMYGSNSYWPNSTFYPRAVPGSSSKFVGIVCGHHDWSQIGHLVLFDTTKGRHEAEGVVQRVPGYGKPVVPLMKDALMSGELPAFVTPFPLSEKYFIAAAQTLRNPGTDIYLVDVFDNGLKLYSAPGRFMIEPMPLRKRPRPPIIPDRTNAKSRSATVVMSNVYSGNGLQGIPHGTVKKLRIYSYNYSLRQMGGQVDRVGLDGPWDVRVIVGTVPVEEDGSATFTVPARIPLAVQPLDEDGKALQYMRSWFTCQPGEVRSCVGCHEDSNIATPAKWTTAVHRKPSIIRPWYGPMRGFSFNREVQPVLDKHCVGCHHGETNQTDRNSQKIVDLTLRDDEFAVKKDGKTSDAAHFPPAYFELKRFVRNATMESDLHMLTPGDFHADQTRLVQLLKKGHLGVKLDRESWDRLITWIDMNTPAHGSWKDIVGTELVDPVHSRRKELMQRYANVRFDPEDVDVFSTTSTSVITPIMPKSQPVRPASIRARHPLQADPQSLSDAIDPETGKLRELIVPISGAGEIHLVRIPAGTFVMGDAAGYEDEWNERPVHVEKPFWMGRFEITNQQYALFDSTHDSRLEQTEFLHFNGGAARGADLNEPLQPVVRISQLEAITFCRWLSEKTGRRFALPSEEQWEWAARYGGCDPVGLIGKDFSKLANLADIRYYTHGNKTVPLHRIAIENVDDGYRVSAPIGKFTPNESGLYDMIGNVAEWTRSKWKPSTSSDPHFVARGGSWRDIPFRARPASRFPYRPEMKVVDVGFRVIMAP